MPKFVEKWTADQVRLLIALDAEIPPLSMSEIAKRIGGGFKKHAIIGKRNRLGLAKRASPLGKGRQPQPLNPLNPMSENRRKKRMPKLQSFSSDLFAGFDLPIRHTAPEVLPIIPGRTCQWILSGDERRRMPLFCDQPARVRRNHAGDIIPCSYCDVHEQAAYKPVATLEISKEMLR